MTLLKASVQACSKNNDGERGEFILLKLKKHGILWEQRLFFIAANIVT